MLIFWLSSVDEDDGHTTRPKLLPSRSRLEGVNETIFKGAKYLCSTRSTRNLRFEDQVGRGLGL